MFQARVVLLIISLGCSLSLGGFCEDAKKQVDLPDFLKPLEEADKVTLYSIDGTFIRDDKNPPPKAAEEFQGYPVLGKLDLKDANTRKEVVQAILKGTQNEDKGSTFCFEPRHAFRAVKAGKSTDYVICFKCYTIKVIVGKDVKDITINREPQVMLNRLLKQASIPIAP